MAANPFVIERSQAPMQGLRMLAPAMQRRGERAIERSKEKQYMKLREDTARIMDTGTPEEIAEFVTKNPGAKAVIDETINFKSEATKRSLVEGAKRRLMGEVDPAESWLDHADLVDREGGNAAQSINAAKGAMQDPKSSEDDDLKILAMYDKASFDSLMKMREGVMPGERVGAQEILEDGTIIQSTSRGPVVYNPQGERVKGQAAADAIKQGRAEKVSNLRRAAGEKKMAALESELELKGKVAAGVISQKEAAKISVKAFDRLEGINQNLRNLEEGISLLREEGANTGVVDKYLPSLRKSSIRLDNLQGQLGLDVLRNTTFGALSASELRFALDTAVPKGLQPLDLADWLEEKKAAQEKLADYIESSAIYFGTPGNTVAGWIQKQKNRRGGAPNITSDAINKKATEMSDAELEALLRGGQ